MPFEQVINNAIIATNQQDGGSGGGTTGAVLYESGPDPLGSGGDPVAVDQTTYGSIGAGITFDLTVGSTSDVIQISMSMLCFGASLNDGFLGFTLGGNTYEFAREQTFSNNSIAPSPYLLTGIDPGTYAVELVAKNVSSSMNFYPGIPNFRFQGLVLRST